MNEKIQNHIEKVEELYELYEVIEKNYEEDKKKHDEKMQVILQDIRQEKQGKRETFDEWVRDENVFQKALEIKEYDLTNFLELSRIIVEGLQREVHYKTTVIADFKGNLPQITVGKFGWGIRHNKQSQRISCLGDIITLFRRADDCIVGLRENGFDNEADIFKQLYEEVGYLRYLNQYLQNIKIPVEDVTTNAVRGFNARTSIKPINIKTIFVRPTPWHSLLLRDDENMQHTQTEFDFIVLEQITEDGKRKIIEILDMLIEQIKNIKTQKQNVRRIVGGNLLLNRL